MAMIVDHELDKQAKEYQKLKPFLRAVPSSLDSELGHVPHCECYSVIDFPDGDSYIMQAWANSVELLSMDSCVNTWAVMILRLQTSTIMYK